MHRSNLTSFPWRSWSLPLLRPVWDCGTKGQGRVKKGSGTGHRRAMKGHERTKEGWVKKWSKTLFLTYRVQFLGQATAPTAASLKLISFLLRTLIKWRPCVHESGLLCTCVYNTPCDSSSLRTFKLMEILRARVRPLLHVGPWALFPGTQTTA